MKKSIVLGFVFVILSLGAVSHAAEFDGEWVGTIDLQGHDYEFQVMIVVQDGKAEQYFESDGNSWRLVNPQRSSFSEHRNNAHLVWLNSGGIWTETQSYHLSMINETTLEVLYTRHVNNRVTGEDGEPWSLVGSGTLTRM